MTTKVLVAYATKHGSTAELAESIADELRGHGLEVDARAANQCSSVDAYDAVIVGSAVYMNRWQSDALDFVRRFARDLEARPTWTFSSGPTGGTPGADTRLATILRNPTFPPGDAGRAARRIGIRGHATFGGRVGEEMTGLFERLLPRGDWRDPEAVRAWARSIVAAFTSPSVSA